MSRFVVIAVAFVLIVCPDSSSAIIPSASIGDAIVNGLKSAWDAIVNWILGLLKSILDALVNLVMRLFSKVTGEAKKLVNRLSSKTRDLIGHDGDIKAAIMFAIMEKGPLDKAFYAFEIDPIREAENLKKIARKIRNASWGVFAVSLISFILAVGLKVYFNHLKKSVEEARRRGFEIRPKKVVIVS